MTHFTRETVVACPPDRVFAVLSNVERLTEFSDMTVAIRKGPGRPVRPGDQFEQAVKVLGIEFDTEWEVTEVEPDTLIRIEGRSKSNGRASLTHHLAPEGTGTRVTFDVDYDPPLGILGEIADKLVFERHHEKEAEQILARLKELCETVPAE